jgi:hypothetical protein
MWSSAFTEQERQVFRKCLIAAGEGPFLDDADLQTICCLRRSEAASLGAGSSPLDISDTSIRRAVRASIFSLLLCLGWQDDDPDRAEQFVREWTGVSEAELARLEERLLEMEPPVEYASLSVHGPSRLGDNWYRVVSYSIRARGEGMSSEIWKNGKWLACRSGPGCNRILSASIATREVLQKAGVDGGPLPEGYDPMRTEVDPEYDPT